MEWLLKNHEVLKNLAQTLAWAGAAVFFLWKTIAGYTLINLSVELGLKRLPASPSGDSLITNIKLSKGDRATLKVHSVNITVLEDSREIASQVVDLPAGGPNRRRLKLTPGETTHLECFFSVASDKVYTVVVEVAGEARVHGPWRASAVSLPRGKSAPDSAAV